MPDAKKRLGPIFYRGQSLVIDNRRTSAWLAFWDASNSIFVNARHKDVHYRQMAEEIARYLPSAAAHVLDYGSGEALHADLIAAAAGEVLLCEGARHCAPVSPHDLLAFRRSARLRRRTGSSCNTIRST
jgi:hypothetical protein